MTIALRQLTVTVNGEDKSFPVPITIDELLAEMGLRRELVAVELNRDLVRRAQFGEQRIHDGDRLEIVEFVGGG
jgi:thiamine biosynthesis protein ThiS